MNARRASQIRRLVFVPNVEFAIKRDLFILCEGRLAVAYVCVCVFENCLRICIFNADL